MRTLRVLGGIVALLAMTGGTAHADSVQASGTCDTLTVTAPAGSRVIVGVDAEPPYEVDDGNTGTFGFFQAADHHTWTVTVLVDGSVVDYQGGAVSDCTATLSVGTTEPAPTIEAPASVPIVSPWAAVELAPPW